MARPPPKPPPVPTARHGRCELRIRLPARRPAAGRPTGHRGSGKKRKEKGGKGIGDTHDDGDGRGSAEDLLDQAVAVVQRLHDLPLALGDLQEGRVRELALCLHPSDTKGQRCFLECRLFPEWMWHRLGKTILIYPASCTEHANPNQDTPPLSTPPFSSTSST